MPRPAIGGMGGDKCIDFKNPIVRTFLSSDRIFAAIGKSRLSVKPLPYMPNYPKILVVEKREREFPRPCHPMTSHRPTPLLPHSLDWMINRMLRSLTTHIRRSTGSDNASTPVWTHLKTHYLCEKVRSWFMLLTIGPMIIMMLPSPMIRLSPCPNFKFLMIVLLRSPSWPTGEG